MDSIIAGRCQMDDEARAAAASLSDLVDKNDISIFSTTSPALMTRITIRKAQVSGDHSAAKRAAAAGGYTGSLAGTAGGLPDKGEATSHGLPSKVGRNVAGGTCCEYR